MDFKLEISRNNVSYFTADLFPNQQLEYDVDFYDRIEIDKVRLPFSTDLRIPLTNLNKSANLLNFEPFAEQGINFPKNDFYFRLTIYGTSNVSIEGILNLESVEYNSSEPYAQVILKDYISRYLAQMKTKNLSVIYSDAIYTTETFVATGFNRPWNDPTTPGQAGVIGLNPSPTQAITFPYVDFVNDIDGKYGYAARQFIEYGTGIGRTGIMPVFSVNQFLTLLGSYLSSLDPNFDVRIDSKLFGIGTPFSGSPLIPDMEPEKLQMLIPSQLLGKHLTNPRTFDVRQSPAWAVPNASLSNKTDINQQTKKFYTQYFSSAITSGNYGTDSEGAPIYPTTQEWGVEKRMGFYPCDPTAVISEYVCDHIRGFFAPKVSFNAAISFVTGTGGAFIEQPRFEIPVVQEDDMVGDIDISASNMEFNVCVGIWVDGLQQKEITLLDGVGGSPLVLNLSGATAVAGYSNKTDSTGSTNYDYFRPDSNKPVLWQNGGAAITDTILFEPFTAFLPSGLETFIDGGSKYSINYFIKPISGQLSIIKATSFAPASSAYFVKLTESTSLYGVTDLKKTISRFGLPEGTGNYGQMNLRFVANEDHLLYKNTDSFIIQESIAKTCPFTLSDVLTNIAKRFDCGLFYDYDAAAQQHILRIDPVFAVRSGTENINQYVDDIKSYKITNGGDKVKTLNIKNKDYNLFFDDIDDDKVIIGSTTQEINTEGIAELKIDLKSSIYYKSVCGEEDFGSSNLNFEDSVVSAEELGLTPNVFTKNKDVGFRFAYIDKPLYKTNMLVPYMYQQGTKTDLKTEVQRFYANYNWGFSGINIGGQHIFNGRLFNYNNSGWNLMFEDESGAVTDTYSQIFAVSEKIIQSEFPSIEFDMVVPTDQLNNLSFFLKEFTASKMTGGTIYVKSAKGDVYEDYAYLTIEALLK